MMCSGARLVRGSWGATQAVRPVGRTLAVMATLASEDTLDLVKLDDEGLLIEIDRGLARGGCRSAAIDG